MHLALTLHPDSRATAAARIDVDVLRPRADELVLRYAVTGNIGGLLLPSPGQPARADELWKHTCFEAFIRGADAADYYEFNFAPSKSWAAYHFTKYRYGMAAADVAPPRIETQARADRFELQAALAWPGDQAWRLALSAVIEETGGAKSYWALEHGPGKPDFHHAESFAYELLGAA